MLLVAFLRLPCCLSPFSLFLSAVLHVTFFLRDAANNPHGRSPKPAERQHSVLPHTPLSLPPPSPTQPTGPKPSRKPRGSINLDSCLGVNRGLSAEQPFRFHIEMPVRFACRRTVEAGGKATTARRGAGRVKTAGEGPLSPTPLFLPPPPSEPRLYAAGVVPGRDGVVAGRPAARGLSPRLCLVHISLFRGGQAPCHTHTHTLSLSRCICLRCFSPSAAFLLPPTRAILLF